MDIKEKAKLFAIKAHYNQVRKSEKDKPMIIHPIDVAEILESYGFDENVVAAGYLHDVIEDTKYTSDDILKEFGSDVLSLVEGNTESDKKLSWEERKQHTIDVAKNLDLRHKAVICADKISNLEDLYILFSKNGKYDFSSFNRGYDSQKWYFENLYNSLIYGVDDGRAMFDRLKKLIDYIFFDGRDGYVENVIFSNKKDEYLRVANLHYKKMEVQKLSRVFKIKPYVIEFTGTPRTGKTTLINNLKDFFKKGSFKVSVLEEFTTSDRYKKGLKLKLKNQYANVVNTEIPRYVLRDLTNEIRKNKDIIIVDRSLVDRLIWVYRLHEKKGISDEEVVKYKRRYIPKIKEKINIVIATYTDSLTSLRRDYKANLSLEKRNFLNESNVNEYNKALLDVRKLADEEGINFKLFDTTTVDEREISIRVANDILDDMRSYYLREIKKEIDNIVN